MVHQDLLPPSTCWGILCCCDKLLGRPRPVWKTTEEWVDDFLCLCPGVLTQDIPETHDRGLVFDKCNWRRGRGGAGEGAWVGEGAGGPVGGGLDPDDDKSDKVESPNSPWRIKWKHWN
jgi:hypothetical protein